MFVEDVIRSMKRKNRSLTANILLNSIKTIMGFIFPLITFPYVSRVLGTVGLGKVNFSSSIVSYFAIIASLGVTNYAIREGVVFRDKGKKEKHFYDEVFTVNFLTVIVAYILLAVAVLISTKLHDYVALIGIHSLSLVFTWIGIEWIFNIYEDYLQITARTVLSQLISLIPMFLFVKTPDDYSIYALITVFASAGTYIINFFLARRYYRPHLTLHCNLKKHIIPMFILGANTFAMTIYINSDTTMIGYMLGEGSVGLYSTGVKIYTIIKHVMAAVITTATPRVAYYHAQNFCQERDKVISSQIKLITLLAVPSMIGLIFTSKDVVFLLAGSEYENSTPVLRVLALAIIFASFASIASAYGLVIDRKEKTVLQGSIISAGINVVLNVLLIPLIGIIGAAITTLISEMFVFFYFTAKADFFKYLLSAKKSIISSIVGSLGIVACCLICLHINNQYLRLAISVVTSVLVYFLIIYFRKEELVQIAVDKILTKLKIMGK